MNKSMISANIDLKAEGWHAGDLRVRWSDNTVPLGYHPVPIISIKNGPGPVALLIAGTHGDEFEGPSALMRVIQDLDLSRLTGQIIVLPALNAPAVQATTRVSPLDNINLNRAFPGDPSGSITQQIAYYVETELLPLADVGIDLHSGGKASVFAPCTLATHTKDPTLFECNLALAEAFGLPLIWVLGGFNDPRSLNSAAERAGVPMIATELGGGGGVDSNITTAAETGIHAILQFSGILDGKPPETSAARKVELTGNEHSLFSIGEGVFDRMVAAGENIKAGQIAGRLHYVSEPERTSSLVVFGHGGFVLAHTNRGYVKRGDMLMLVAQDVTAID
ncbi:MAG: succinylglutamate desuccinylase/aspartoacylase family protein [Roseobacter sp.]